MKILILDIETAPNLAYVWSLWDQNVSLDQLVDVGNVICFAAKWHGEKDIQFYSDFHDGHDKMVLKAHELLSEADAIVHYNGKTFDIKHLNREFVLAGLAPPAPHKDIDLYSVVKSRFRFSSNKLQHIATQLGIGSKTETGGFKTWIRCMEGDEKAWAAMRKYNIGDVKLTEEVYDRLLPWIKAHPSVSLYDGYSAEIPACPNCGSTHLQKRGFYRTKVSTYQQYQCQNKGCGAWSRHGTRDDAVKIQSV